MITLNYSIRIQLSGGPQVVTSRTSDVLAFDKAEVTVAPGGSNAAPVLLDTDIHPSENSNVVLLWIGSSLYDGNLSYVISDGGDNSQEATLVEPQLFLGSAMNLLKFTPKYLKIKNTHDPGDKTKTATIEVLVVRKQARPTA